MGTYSVIIGIIIFILLIKTGIFGVTINTKKGKISTLSKSDPNDSCGCAGEKPKKTND